MQLMIHEAYELPNKVEVKGYILCACKEQITNFDIEISK